MWARRFLRVPPLWPSRIKVLILSVTHTSILLQARHYLQTADVTYVNLQLPVGARISCRRPKQGVCSDEPLLQCLLHNKSHGFGLRFAELLPERCPWPEAPLCNETAVPAKAFSDEELGRLHVVGKLVNPLEGWSTWFLVLVLCLCGSILIHDLALLQREFRPRIYSLLSMKQEWPKLWALQRYLRCENRMHQYYREDFRRWMYLCPLQLAWQLVVYMFFLYPLLLLVLIYSPIRMSRVAVFLSGIFCTLWAIGFLGLGSYESLIGREYAVLWDRTTPFHHRMAETPGVRDCVCYCEHPLNQKTTARLLQIGVLAIVCAAITTFQALKGLRLGRWANLFSVQYPVPIEVFPVEWCRPSSAGGGPIQNRTEGMPVQGEPAFDPFCLMDEQPESWRSRLRLAPEVEAVAEARETHWGKMQSTEDKPPTFCGFPRFSTRGSSEALGLPLEDGPDGETCKSQLLPPL